MARGEEREREIKNLLLIGTMMLVAGEWLVHDWWIDGWLAGPKHG